MTLPSNAQSKTPPTQQSENETASAEKARKAKPDKKGPRSAPLSVTQDSLASFRSEGASTSKPSGKSPAGVTPAGSKPSGKTPAGSKPSGKTPDGTSPADSKTSGKTPDGTTPAGSKPSSKTPDGTVLVATTPDGATPARSVITHSTQQGGSTPVSPPMQEITASDSAQAPADTPKGTKPWNEAAPETGMDEASLAEPDAIEEEHGVDTEQLSDITDEGENGGMKSSSSSHLFSFLNKFAPIIRDRRIRHMAVYNVLMLAVNSLFLLAFTSLMIQFMILKSRVNQSTGYTTSPCLYVYGEFGECSATCDDGTTPTMTRRISAFIEAEGSSRRCPDKIRFLEDTIPCNFYKCAKNISDFEWMDSCFYNNVTLGKNGSCYKIRNIKINEHRDQLVHFDANLTMPCEDTECPEDLKQGSHFPPRENVPSSADLSENVTSSAENVTSSHI